MRDVSVILPTWNRPQFLRAAIDSVLGQTVAIRELLIADDGSDTPARTILEEYAARPGVRVLWREHRGNPGAVRNAAIREAKGRYIAFADSDDTWHAEKLERQFSALRERPLCRWSYSACRCVDAADRPIDSLSHPDTSWQEESLVEMLATLRAHVPLPSVLAERALLIEAGLFDESFGCYADYDLWIRLASLADAAGIRDPLVTVRLHDRHFSRGNGYEAASGREKFLGQAIDLVRSPAVRARLERMRALDSARLAGLAALSGDATEAVSRIRGSFAHGWTMPRWWFWAVRAHSRLWMQRS